MFTRFEKYVGRITAGLLTLALLLLPASTRAQQSSSPDEEQQAEKSEQGETDSKVGDQPRPTHPVPEEIQITELGTASPLSIDLSILRWGSFFVRSAEIIEIVDHIDRPGEFNNTQVNVSLFRTHLGFDHQFRRSRIAFQYAPYVSIVNGQVDRNFSNQNVSLDTVFTLSPRWTLSLQDKFTYYGDRNRFESSFLHTDLARDSALQGAFLDGPGDSIANNVRLTVSYEIARRTRLTVSPHFSYQRTRRNFLANGLPGESTDQRRSYGARVSLNKALSATKIAGVFYSSEWSRFSARFDDTLFQTLGFRYSHQFSPGWRFHSTVGASTALRDTGPRQWTARGQVRLLRSFQNSALSISFSRDHTFPGFITDTYHDRVDLGYSPGLGRRVRAQLGIGYLRAVRSTRNISGKYAAARLSVRLSSNFRWFVNYIRKDQDGDGIQVSSGIRNTVAMGIQWVHGNNEALR